MGVSVVNMIVEEGWRHSYQVERTAELPIKTNSCHHLKQKNLLTKKP